MLLGEGGFAPGKRVDYLNEVVESEGLTPINAYIRGWIDVSLFEEVIHLVGIEGTIYLSLFENKPSLFIVADGVLWDIKGVSDPFEVNLSFPKSGIVSKEWLVWNDFIFGQSFRFQGEIILKIGFDFWSD